jgi:hypothetical protein
MKRAASPLILGSILIGTALIIVILAPAIISIMINLRT